MQSFLIGRMAFSFLLFGGSLIISPAMAQQQATVKDKCSVHQAATEIGLGNTNAYLSNMVEQFRLLNEIKGLAGKAADPDKPLNQQLTPQDINRFNSIRQRIIFLRMTNKIEDEHYRFSRILEKIWRVAEARYYQRPDAAELTGPNNYGSLLDIIRARFPTTPQILNEITRPPGATCTIELALFRSETEVLSQVPQFERLASDQARDLDLIRSRHHLPQDAPIGDDILSPREQATVDRWRSVSPDLLVAMDRTLLFIGDMEHLRSLARASELIFQQDKQNWIRSGGNVDALGQRSSDDPKMRSMFSIWNIIDERAPSFDQLQKQERTANSSLK